MISLEIACKNAETMMLKYGYVKGFLDIRETDTKWFFVGSLSEDGPTPFAVVPFFVKKRLDRNFSFLPKTVPDRILHQRLQHHQR